MFEHSKDDWMEMKEYEEERKWLAPIGNDIGSGLGRFMSSHEAEALRRAWVYLVF